MPAVHFACEVCGIHLCAIVLGVQGALCLLCTCSISNNLWASGMQCRLTARGVTVTDVGISGCSGQLAVRLVTAVKLEMHVQFAQDAVQSAVDNLQSGYVAVLVAVPRAAGYNMILAA